MSKVINLDALRRKANPSFVAVKPEHRKFGFDYLPPMTAGLINYAPVRHPMHTAQLLAKAGKLPDNFNWADPVDVATKRLKGKASDASNVAKINTPLNQLACGSCWAFASSSTLADRHTLFQGLPETLVLSPSYLLACDQGSSQAPCEGCDGGFPFSAGLFFESTGIPTWKCQDYEWCPTNENATNDEIPPCAQIGSSCYELGNSGGVQPTTPIPKMYKAVSNSTQALSDPASIKAEVWHNGPVVGTFLVYSDFIGRDRSDTNKPGWANTANIYINMGSGLYDGYSNSERVGGHAVVIVGWGLELNIMGLDEITTKKLKAKYNGIPYWWVRNSWGGTYNGNGYFKMAQSDPELGINMTCGLDRIITVDAGGGQTFNTGGGTTFLPDVKEKEPKIIISRMGSPAPPKPSPPPPSPKPSPSGGGGKGSPSPSGGGGGGGSPSPSGGGGSSSGGDSSNFWTQPGGISVIVVSSVVFIALIVIIAVVVKNKKKKAALLKGGRYFI